MVTPWLGRNIGPVAALSLWAGAAYSTPPPHVGPPLVESCLRLSTVVSIAETQWNAASNVQQQRVLTEKVRALVRHAQRVAHGNKPGACTKTLAAFEKSMAAFVEQSSPPPPPTKSVRPARPTRPKVAQSHVPQKRPQKATSAVDAINAILFRVAAKVHGDIISGRLEIPRAIFSDRSSDETRRSLENILATQRDKGHYEFDEAARLITELCDLESQAEDYWFRLLGMLALIAIGLLCGALGRVRRRGALW